MKEESADSQESDPTPDSDFASVVEGESDKDKSITKKKRKARGENHRKSYRRSWRSASPLTKLMIYFTAITAFSTTLYCIFSALQWHEISSGGEETRRVAQAARDSADAAQKQAAIAEAQAQSVRDSAQAAKDSASAANRVVEQNKDLIKSAEIQANTSQVSARAAEKSAEIATRSFALTQRPSVYFDAVDIEPFKEGGVPEVHLLIKNGGGVNAYNITVDTVFSYHQKPVSEELKYPSASGYGVVGASILVPGGTGLQARVRAQFRMTDAAIKAVMEDRFLLVFWGSGEYFDGLGRKYRLEDFCFFYSPDEQRLILCAKQVQTERRYQ